MEDRNKEENCGIIKGMKTDYSNTGKSECSFCWRWNKVSVRWCKCGQENPDYEMRSWNTRGMNKVDNRIESNSEKGYT